MTSTVRDRQQRLAAMLSAKREELARALARDFGARLGEDALASQDGKIEVGDRSVSVLGEDLEFSMLERRRRELRRVDEALARLVDGSYGRCQDCDAEIEEARLEIMPFATQCVPCRRKQELEERRVEATGRGFRAGFRDVREGGDDEPEGEE